MDNKNKDLNRRQFLGTAAAISALGTGALMSACKGGANVAELNLPPLLDQAPDGRELKAGLVGCGGRGRGAMINFLDSGPNLKVVALADVFQDRIDKAKEVLKEKNLEVPDEKCFLGFDAFRKVIDSGVDVVILATPPHFRPEHFEACVTARKHVFMEKPVAVDPVGARSIMSSAKKAEGLDLKVVTGTQRRHQRDYIETYKKIMGGAIGDIVSAN